MPNPPNPSAFQRVNFVTHMWTYPCDAPLHVLVETMWPAALRAAIGLTCWGFTDVVRWFFRPVHLRRTSHFARRRNRSRSRRRPTWDNRLRQITPGMSEFGARPISQGVYTLWRIDGVVQKWLWWMVLIDVTTGFFYNWTTLLYKSEYCQAAGANAAVARNGDTTSLPSISDWEPVAVNNVDYEHGTTVTGPFAAVLGPGSWIVSFACRPTHFTIADGTFGCRIVAETDDGDVIFSEGMRSKESALASGAIAIAKISGPVRIEWQARVTQGFANTENFLWIYQGPESLPPPIDYECATIPLTPPPITGS